MNRKLGFLIILALVVVVAIVLVFTQVGRRPAELPTTVKVAVILPQTGPQAAIGRGATNSVRLAFHLAQESFSEEEIECELMILDDASKPETAVAAAQRACSDGEVVLAVAHFNSPCALATVDIFHEAGLPVIVPAAVNSEVTAGGYPEVVRTCNTDIEQAVFMARFLLGPLKARKIYVIHDNSAFGKGLIDALAVRLTAEGIQFAGQDAFHVGDVDFSSVIARIQDAEPEVVVIGCMAAEGALLRRQMVEKNVRTPLVGFSGIFYETFIRNAGDAGEGVRAIFPLPPLEEVEGGRQFVTSYEMMDFGEPFESAGPFGYVAGQVAVQTLLSGALSRSSVIEYLRNNTFETAFGPLAFDQQGEMTLKMISFYEVIDGRWTVTHRVDETGDIVPTS